MKVVSLFLHANKHLAYSFGNYRVTREPVHKKKCSQKSVREMNRKKKIWSKMKVTRELFR